MEYRPDEEFKFQSTALTAYSKALLNDVQDGNTQILKMRAKELEVY
jgi:hypothetical protein